MIRSKLGLQIKDEMDSDLIQDLENTLRLTETDMTIFFRNLANVPKDMEINEDLSYLNYVNDAFYSPDEITDTFYKPDELKDTVITKWKSWFRSYMDRLQKESLSDENRKSEMNKVNPKYVLRNYMAQLAIDSAEKGDYNLIDQFYKLLKNPYDDKKKAKSGFQKDPNGLEIKLVVQCSLVVRKTL